MKVRRSAPYAGDCDSCITSRQLCVSVSDGLGLRCEIAMTPNEVVDDVFTAYRGGYPSDII